MYISYYLLIHLQREISICLSRYSNIGSKAKFIFFKHSSYMQSASCSSISFREMSYNEIEILDEETKSIILKVKGPNVDEVWFKINSTDWLKILTDGYCKKFNLNIHSVDFLFNGEKLQDSQTPKDLNLKNGDLIEVVKLDSLLLQVQSHYGSTMYFKQSKHFHLKKLMELYCQKQGLNINHARFFYHDQLIQETDNPHQLKMENTYSQSPCIRLVLSQHS